MTRLPTLRRHRLLPLALALCAGCSLSQPYPAKQLYALDAGRPSAAAPAAPGAAPAPAIRVSPVRVAGPFDDRLFHYRVGPARYEADYYANFVAEPGSLITAQLVDWLAATGNYEAVVDAASPVGTDRSLRLVINELSIDRREPDAERAVVAARCFLLDESAVEARVLMVHDYEETEPVNGPGGDAMAEAWGRALGRLFAAIEADVRAAS